MLDFLVVGVFKLADGLWICMMIVVGFIVFVCNINNLVFVILLNVRVVVGI